ncbi:MAG: peptidoglycan-associated lipoprotein Pal [Deltaproteobacteria bacterium]|nr:peptidoglycan-associated lipoprotein Pal [Deltaproteobacteria bacterium]
MRRLSFQWTLACLCAALLTLGAAGCAKKQIREEGGAAAPKAEVRPEVTPAPSPAPAPGVGEQRLPPPAEEVRPEARTQPAPAEPPPPRTAAERKAPEAPAAERAGMAGQTGPGLARIHFDFDKAVLGKEAQETLKRNAKYLSDRQGVRIRIEGHCDERGTTEYNLALGERRAKAAQQYLMDLGIDPNRMTVVSYGKEQPLDPGHTEEAWAKNRRAEFVEIQK